MAGEGYASVFIDFGTYRYAAMGSKSCECGHTAANYAANYFVPAGVNPKKKTEVKLSCALGS
jgi:hypothetical protein